MRHFDRVLFFLGLAVLVFGYGVVVGKYKVFPHDQLQVAVAAAASLKSKLEGGDLDAAEVPYTRGGVVEIQRCGASICGRLVTSELLRTQPNLKDANNKDASLRNRPLKGLMLLSGFKGDGDAWSGGTIYNADDGKTYNAKLTPIGNDKLKVRGCVFVPLCKTQTWTRLR